MIESSKLVAEQLDDVTRATREQGSESGKTALQMITAWATVKANLLPFVSFVKNLAVTTGSALAVIITGAVGYIIKGLEDTLNAVERVTNDIVNVGIRGANYLGSFVGLPQISQRTASPPVDLGSRFVLGKMNEAIADLSSAARGLAASVKEGEIATRRVLNAGNPLFARQDSGEFAQGRIPLMSPTEERLARATKLAEDAINGKKATAHKAAAEHLTELQRLDKSSERATMKTLYEMGQRAGFVAGTNQSIAAHNKGSFHPLGRALDFSVRGKSPAQVAQFISELREQGFTVFDERTRPAGQRVWGGPHVHAQFGAGGIGKDRGFGPAEFAARALLADMRSRSIETFGGLSGIQPTSRLTEDEKYLQIRKQSLDYENQLTQAVLRRRNIESEAQESYSQATLDLINIESDLIKVRLQNADDQFTEQRRLLTARSEEVDLLRQLQRVQDDLANGPLNQSLRIQLALMEDISQIRRREEEAIKSQHRSQLELADAEVFHGEQARAMVLDHLSRSRTQTEVFADAIISSYEAINDMVFKGVQKITGGISILDNLIAGLITRLTNRLFQKLLDVLIPGGNSPGQAAGVQTGGGFGSIIQSLTGGFAGGGGSILSRLLGTGGGITAPASLTAAAGGTTWKQMGTSLGSPGDYTNLLKGGGLAGLAGMLPMLGLGTGLGLGVAAGGQSGLGQILGGIGGLGVGGALGMAAFTALGGTVPASLVPFLAAAGPIALIAGPLLIAGAIILAKNKARQQAEKQRTVFAGTALDQVYQLLWATQRGEFTSSSARAKYQEIHTAYLAQTATIKDSKTRRNAELWWGDVDRDVWPKIEEAATQSAKRANDRARMSPVFAQGGINQMSQLIRVSRGEGWRNPGSNVVNVVPGRFEGREDTEFMFARRGTEIIPRRQMQGASGFAEGTGGSFAPQINIEVNIDKDGMGQAIVTSPLFKTAVIRNVKIGRLENKI
jgi:uncharacterized protein YcbK (DUF882 family)